MADKLVLGVSVCAWVRTPVADEDIITPLSGCMLACRTAMCLKASYQGLIIMPSEGLEAQTLTHLGAD